ncbi:MAG: hypothetical protein KUG83_09920 [Gammaproteobacteria bacterium]|nr:hypothetical protein [Gammaproteobacteria bacterium]
MKKIFKSSISRAFACSIAFSAGGLLTVESVSASASQQQDDMPRSGVSKQFVEREFGAPKSSEKAVGEPPISIWHYGRYSVYFENNTAIRSVMHKN